MEACLCVQCQLQSWALEHHLPVASCPCVAFWLCFVSYTVSRIAYITCQVSLNSSCVGVQVWFKCDCADAGKREWFGWHCVCQAK